MACCIKLITTQAIPNQEFLLSLLETLQLKLVDLNPNVQEAAVKAVGDLMLWGKGRPLSSDVLFLAEPKSDNPEVLPLYIQNFRQFLF